MMEDFLAIKDLSNIPKGEESRFKYIFEFGRKKMTKKAIACIRLWIHTSSHHNVTDEASA